MGRLTMSPPIVFFRNDMADIFLSDLLQRRDRGITSATRFLNEAELALTLRDPLLSGTDYLVCGGYRDAVRARIIFPAYWETGTVDAGEYVASVKICGSGYVKLSHSDFLGSLTGLGISRDFLGDIVVGGDGASAVLFCDPSIRKFLLSEPSPLERVGRDRVKTEDFTPDGDFTSGRGYEPLCLFVSSMRTDCVVAALCGVSREKAKDLVLSCSVVCNYAEATAVDRQLESGDIISVRGKGKYRIDSFAGTTKKGRIKLNVLKYV